MLFRSLTMKGITHHTSLSQASIQALNAGIDMLLVVDNLNNIAQLKSGILHAVQKGILTEKRIHEALLKINTLKKKITKHPLPIPHFKKHHLLAQEIRRKAITCVQPDNKKNNFQLIAQASPLFLELNKYSTEKIDKIITKNISKNNIICIIRTQKDLKKLPSLKPFSKQKIAFINLGNPFLTKALNKLHTIWYTYSTSKQSLTDVKAVILGKKTPVGRQP